MEIKNNLQAEMIRRLHSEIKEQQQEIKTLNKIIQSIKNTIDNDYLN